MYESGEPSGPMLNGTTYIVRPRIEPRKSSVRWARISPGSLQLLVGPASSSRSEQMNVRSSTRATSLGSETAQYDPGRFFGSSSTNVPDCTNSLHRRSNSSSEPSHQCTASGWQSSATSATHPRRRWLLVGGALSAMDTAGSSKKGRRVAYRRVVRGSQTGGGGMSWLSWIIVGLLAGLGTSNYPPVS